MVQPSLICSWKINGLLEQPATAEPHLRSAGPCFVFMKRRRNESRCCRSGRLGLTCLVLLLTCILGCGRSEVAFTPSPSRPVDQPSKPRSAADHPDRQQQRASPHVTDYQDNLADADSRQCAECHADQFKNFARSGMARTWRSVAEAAEAVSSTSAKAVLAVDPTGGYRYEVSLSQDRVAQTETHPARSEHRLTQHATYAVGSGKRAVAWLAEEHGYLTQLPVAWFHADASWRLNPGYELGNHRFDRPITPGCVACHTTGAIHEWPTENRFQHPIRSGIACQRCHGTAAEHIAYWRGAGRGRSDTHDGISQTSTGHPVPPQSVAAEASKPERKTPVAPPGTSAPQILPTDSTPTLLAESASAASDASERAAPRPQVGLTASSNLTSLQANDLCLQCHLQGDVMLYVQGQGPLDFRVGDQLAEHRQDYQVQAAERVSSVASHGAAFLQSRCYLGTSAPPTNKSIEVVSSANIASSTTDHSARFGTLTCIHCHDPHRPAADFDRSFYDSRCATCHERLDCRQLAQSLTDSHATASTPSASPSTFQSSDGPSLSPDMRATKANANDETGPSRTTAEQSCIACHMPQRDTREGLHLMVTDHRILARPDPLASHSSDRRPLPPNAQEFELVRVQPATRAEPHELGAAYVRLHETMPPQPVALQRAVKLLAEPVRLDPSNLEARYWLGSAQLALGQGAEAVGHLRVVVKHFPNRLDARFRLAAAEELTGQAADAAGQYGHIIQAAPSWLEPYSRLAPILLAAQRPDMAVALLEQQRQYRETPLGLAQLAFALRLTGGSQDQSLRYLDRARQLAPHSAQVDLLRAGYWLADRKTDQARMELQRILTYEPQHSEALAALKRLSPD
jgi:hypothetical protein